MCSVCADTDNDGAIQWDELRGPIKATATKAKGTQKGARGRDLAKARVLATAQTRGGLRRGASSREHRHFPLA